MEKIKLRIVGISYSQSQSGAYALLLEEENGKRRLPIIIGSFEAQSIAIELEKMKPTRPLTHDLFKIFCETFRISIKEVIIYKFAEGIFYAKIICTEGNSTYDIDSRTSDAVAIALRVHCPICTYDNILNAAGVPVDKDTDEIAEPDEKTFEEKAPKKISESEFTRMSVTELEELLKRAVEEEAYEKASKIRDEINKRKKGKAT